MTTGEKQTALVALAEARSRLDALFVRVLAEQAMLASALQHDAKDLMRIGKRILDVVAPEVGECHEAKMLAEERGGVGARSPCPRTWGRCCAVSCWARLPPRCSTTAAG